MIKTILLSLLLVPVLTGLAFAGPAESPKKDRVVIYNLKLPKKTTQKDFAYYTQIIPSAVAKNLQVAGKYSVQKISEEIELSPRANEGEYKKLVRSIAKKYTADFIVTGTCTVEENNLFIEIYVTNVKAKEEVQIIKESKETGAILKETVDDLASVVEHKISKFQEENKIRFGPSGMLRFYNAMKNTSFGFDIGKFYLKGGWSDLFNDSMYIRPTIMFNSRGLLGVSFGMDYLTANNKGRIASAASYFQMYGIVSNLNLFLRFSKMFSVSLAPGGGVAFTKLKIFPSLDAQPFQHSLASKSARSPYLDSSVAFNVDVSHVLVRFGSTYKRVFYHGKDLEMYAMFFGLSYNL